MSINNNESWKDDDFLMDNIYIAEPWENQDTGLMSPGMYNLAIGAVLFWGFGINAITCTFFKEQVLGINPFLLLIVYVIACFVGIMVYRASDNALVSFIGYNLIVLPMGAVLTNIVHYYSGETIEYVFLVTCVVTLVLMGLSTAFPSLFLSMGGTLGVCLLLGLVVEVLFMLFGYSGGVFDFFFVLLFCGYIGYDWAKAQEQPRSLDAAVDSACELYVDLVNLFVRLLQILGRNRNSRD